MQKGIDIPYAPYYNNAMYAPRSYSRSSDGSDSHSGSGGGGGGASYRRTVNPHELVDSPYRSQGSQLDDSPYIPGREMFPHILPGAPEMHGNAYAYPSFDPGYQRQGVDVYGHGYHQPETAPIPVRRTPIAPTDPNGINNHTRSSFYNRDGPPAGVPDPGDYLRQKHHIPPHIEVNLNALSDPAEGQRPTHALPTLISLAIYGSPRKMLTLQEIYAVVATRFEWYKMNPKEGWKNSIRHNLSLNLLFRKKNRPITEPGKGHYWYIDISSGEGNKRLRKRRNKSSRVQDSIEDEDDEVDSIDEEMEGLGGGSPGPYDNIDPALLLESSLASASSSSRSLPSSGSSSSIGGRRGGSSGRRWTSPTSTALGTRHSARQQQQQQQQQEHAFVPGPQLYQTPNQYGGGGPATFHESYLAAAGISVPQQNVTFGHPSFPSR